MNTPIVEFMMEITIIKNVINVIKADVFQVAYRSECFERDPSFIIKQLHRYFKTVESLCSLVIDLAGAGGRNKITPFTMC